MTPEPSSTTRPGGEPLVTLDRVDVRLAGRTLVEGISLVLRRGRGLALLGPNGSGKSTVLRLLRGEVGPHPRSPGRRLFHLGEVSESPIGARERLALVSPDQQDLYARRDLELSVEAVVRSGFSDALYPAEPATPAQARRIREVAGALGVGHLLSRSFLTLSRGEGRRVLLARALAPGPEALLLDEAADGLDAAARDDLLVRVEAILRGGTAVVMATHREEELPPGIEEVVRLEGGRVVPGSSPSTREPEPANWTGAGEEGRGEGGRHAVFTLRGVTVLVDGRAVLRDLDWIVRAGERWGVLGPNGAGKSTLLRLLAGEEQPAEGSIERLDLGSHADRWALAGRIGLVSPELQARHRHGALAEHVAATGFEGTIGLDGPPLPGRLEAARGAMERLGAAALVGRDVSTLSYGELRKLLLARALVAEPAVLLLDEPLAGLDPAGRAATLSVMDDAARAGATLVVVTHHPDELPSSLDRVARLDGGRLVTA